MEASTKLRLKLAATALGILATAAACAPQAEPTFDVTHELTGCGKETEVDMTRGSKENINATEGGSAAIVYNADGTFTVNGVTMAANPNTVQVGDVLTNHLDITIQGDTDSDGKINVLGKSICPAPLPTPQPTTTPITEIKGSQRYAAAPRGFYQGRASKPVRVYSRF